MYIYFIPVFAQTFGATFLDLGFIGSASALAYALTPILVGFLADRFNRAWLFVLGVSINALAAITLTLSGSVRDIVILRLLGGFGFGFFWPTAEVLVTDLAPSEKRVREMGRYSVAWASGFLIGPSIGGLIVERFGYIFLFEVAGIAIACSVVPALLRIVPRYRGKPTTPSSFSGTISTILQLLPWYLMSLSYGVVFSVISAVFPGYANYVGVEPFLIGVLFTAFGISRVVIFATAERYLRFGEKKALLIASGFVVLAALIIAIFPNFAAFLVAFVMIGGGFGVIFPLTISLISRHFPDQKLGVAIGSYEAIFGVGFTVGPLMAGIVATAASISFAFQVTSLFGVLMILFALSGRTYSSPASGKS
jgi:MFS family permease